MTIRLTVAQACVRFLAAQYSERDGVRQRLIPGCFGIFGHGNVAGVAQGLLQAHETGEADLPYYLARNEQAMVHAAVGFARMRNRLQALACTASIGPGSTNMVTGAALATINRIPVLLLPSDFFATRVANPVLQELEDPRSHDTSVNDAFKPVSRYWDRINRPEQLPSALLAAMRVLTDPAETGAVTLALPQDVQAQAHEWPEELFAERVWFVPRPIPEPAALDRAVAVLKSAQRPLIVAGGGVIYSEASAALLAFAEATGIPVADTQAGKGALAWDHPLAAGGVGATGSPVANALAREADVVLGIGTRYSDFTTASRTAFGHPDVRFVNLNVTAFDAGKHAGAALVADARAGLEALAQAMAGYRTDDAYTARVAEHNASWRQEVDHAYHLGHQPLPAQTEVLGTLNELMDDRDVVVQAAGSMPGDLQMLWRASDPKSYHVEYGYSCMGYEIAGGLGIKLAAPDREVFVLVGDGSYLMMATEIVTAVSEGIKLNIVLVQNQGFGSIGSLSSSLGSQRFGTAYRYRNPSSGLLDGDILPVDLAANAASLGADVLRVKGIDEFGDALRQARASDRTTVVYIETDPLAPVPDPQSWWDVPVSEVAALESTKKARAVYEAAKRAQRPYLKQPEGQILRMRTIQHWIAGSETAGASTRYGPVYNPATGAQQAQVALAETADVDAAVAAAKKAFDEWRDTSLMRRSRIMFALRDLIERNIGTLAELIADEHGKVVSDAAGEVTRGLEVVEFACGIPTLLKGEFSEQVSTDVDAYSFRQPLGVVAGITPFNFPAMVPLWMHPVAIATGNTFVLKPSERDPSASNFIAQLYAEAGLPEGVFNVVHGDKVAVDAILDHPDIAAVSFVGSTPIAKYVHQRATENGKRVQALGGAKNHAVVLPDADIEFAANHITAAGYGSAGQRCMAISAVVAVGDAGDALIARLKDKAEEVKVGPGRDQTSEMGPVVTPQARDRITGYVDRGEAAGATLVVDGRGLTVDGHEDGFFVGPTLFDQVSTDMDIYTDEIFGPVLVVIRAESFDEAIGIVNANPYGNGTAIFTSSGHAARTFQRQVQVGMIGVNVPIPVPMAFYSFGGWKDSLFGDTHVHGPEGIRFYTRAKAITSRWPDTAYQGHERAQLHFPTAT
jgi:3D-(3,5/4)-trihydroxycyclohexane-1,2-dione acylhydrolase (decyclizing)